MRYDLHVHTTASDGIKSPEEIVLMAAQAGLAGLAITDHDNLDGLAIAQAFIMQEQIPLEFIPGVELNTDCGQDEVHILGYFIDYQNPRLKARLADIRQERYSRAEKIVNKLKHLGVDISLGEVERFAKGDLIGRPHIARAICAKGYVNSEDQAFAKYIGQGQPAYVPRYKFTPPEAIELIKTAGGIAVLAHPGLIKDSSIICSLLVLGLDGLEVYYPEHTPEQIQQLINLSRSRDLLMTGGSDYHGSGDVFSRSQLGSAGIDDDLMDRMRKYRKKNLKN